MTNERPEPRIYTNSLIELEPIRYGERSRFEPLMLYRSIGDLERLRFVDPNNIGLRLAVLKNGKDGDFGDYSKQELTKQFGIRTDILNGRVFNNLLENGDQISIMRGEDIVRELSGWGIDGYGLPIFRSPTLTGAILGGDVIYEVQLKAKLENQPRKDWLIPINNALNFGRCELWGGIPGAFEDMAKFDASTLIQSGLIATSLPLSTIALLAELYQIYIDPSQIVFESGGIEGIPVRNKSVKMIVDRVETGATAIANGITYVLPLASYKPYFVTTVGIAEQLGYQILSN